jgi:hypothetical protein
MNNVYQYLAPSQRMIIITSSHDLRRISLGGCHSFELSIQTFELWLPLFMPQQYQALEPGQTSSMIGTMPLCLFIYHAQMIISARPSYQSNGIAHIREAVNSTLPLKIVEYVTLPLTSHIVANISYTG